MQLSTALQQEFAANLVTVWTEELEYFQHEVERHYNDLRNDLGITTAIASRYTKLHDEYPLDQKAILHLLAEVIQIRPQIPQFF